MAFVRTKKVRGKEYHQLVESRRVDGEPRQRVLVHLGEHATADAALEAWPKEIRRLRRLATRQRGTAANLPEGDASCRGATRRARRAEVRADRLRGNLEELRRLRKGGVA
jgi:predicted anti-sigma-YlaC factor YlaD